MREGFKISRPISAAPAEDARPQSEALSPRFRIEDIYPSVDGGRYAAKRILGEPVEIWADIFGDGHGEIAASLRWQRDGESDWHSADMSFDGNDRWHTTITPPRTGWYTLEIHAWSNRFATWRKGLLLKQKAGQDVSVDILEGVEIIRSLMPAQWPAKQIVQAALKEFARTTQPDALISAEVAQSLATSDVRSDLSQSRPFLLLVERERARFGAWYEMVPRSQGATPGQHGTFADCTLRVPDIAAQSYDVLYLTPIHPIGKINRKGRNNSLTASKDDPGSFYAIGAESGGHDAVHPELGTLSDFRKLVDTCRAHRMEIAMDIAVQCAPDHPWLKQHPEWFKRRPDGTIKYAENPPKKYEDIVNPDLYCADYPALWNALRDVILHWVDQGVEIFRIDNPHTKPLPFWEWLIREVHLRNSDVIFLSEAFTRPKLMKALAKLGFSQSYTYFTWRTEKAELQEYVSELTRFPEREYFRPNFFVTTPDILPVQLQTGERWLFKARAALAALLSSNYGIYNGFELLEYEPLPGREEYLNSEKYEIRTRDWKQRGNIADYLGKLNAIRRENAALQQTADIQFLPVEDEHLTAFVKTSDDKSNVVVSAISLSPQARELWLPLGETLVAGDPVRAIENLVTGERRMLEWGGVRLWIDPQNDPAQIFRCIP